MRVSIQDNYAPTVGRATHSVGASSLWVLAALLIAGMLAGCRAPLSDSSVVPQQLPPECRAVARSKQIPIDHRMLGGVVPKEHIAGPGDVLGIYIADILGNREELPSVSYPHYRIRNAPTEPFVGQPIKVETDGSIHLPYIEPFFVEGMTLQEIREAIREAYAATDFVRPGREHIVVTLITPRFCRIHVFRQDTRYNVPGLQRSDQFETSRRWSGTILYLEPKEATVITALLQTGGLPGIDARNEIWVMKRVSAEEAAWESVPVDEQKLIDELPMMLPKENTRLVRIPLHVAMDEELPFQPDDVVLGDGDVVFLPRRDGDVFLTGGLLGGGRFPLARDRDIDILEAIAVATGNPLGPVGDMNSVVRFRSGPGNIIPPTDAVVIRRLSETEQFKIRVDLRKALDDPTERLRIAPGDLIVLNYRPQELFANVIMNLFDYNFSLTRGLR